MVKINDPFVSSLDACIYSLDHMSLCCFLWFKC